MVTSATKSRKRRRQERRREKRHAHAQFLVLHGWEPVAGEGPGGHTAWGVTNGEVIVAIQNHRFGVYAVRAMNFPGGFYRPAEWKHFPPSHFYAVRNYLSMHMGVPV